MISIKSNPVLTACFEGSQKARQLIAAKLNTVLRWPELPSLLHFSTDAQTNTSTLLRHPNLEQCKAILIEKRVPIEQINRVPFILSPQNLHSSEIGIECVNAETLRIFGMEKLTGIERKTAIIELDPNLPAFRTLMDNRGVWDGQLAGNPLILGCLEAAIGHEASFFSPFANIISAAVRNQKHLNPVDGIDPGILMHNGVKALAQAPRRGPNGLPITKIERNGTHLIIKEKTFAGNIVETVLNATQPFYVESTRHKQEKHWYRLTAHLAPQHSPLELASFFVRGDSPEGRRISANHEQALRMTDLRGVYALEQGLLDAILKPKSRELN